MKNTRRATTYWFWLIFLAIVSIAGSLVAYVSAYFTASANKSGEILFHDIALEVNTTNADNAIFAANVPAINPGDTLTLSNISVKNSGTADIYALVNINISITRPGYADYNLDYWRNLTGGNVNVSDMSSNSTKATIIATGASSSLSFSHDFTGATFDNTFRGASARVTVRAVGIQTENLEAIGSITDSGLVASYMLIDEFYTYVPQNVVDIAQFETQTTVNYTIPNERGNDDTYNYNLYSIDVANVEEVENLYLQVKNVDQVYIIPGTYDLSTFTNTDPEDLPDAHGDFQIVYALKKANSQASEVQSMGLATTQELSNSLTLATVITLTEDNKIPEVRLYVEPQDDLPDVVDGVGVFNVDYAKIKTGVAQFNNPITTGYYEESSELGYFIDISDFKITNVTEDSTITVFVPHSWGAGVYESHVDVEDHIDACDGNFPSGAVVSNFPRVFGNEFLWLVTTLDVKAGDSLEFCVAASYHYDSYNTYNEEFDIAKGVYIYVQPKGNLPACKNGVGYYLTEDRSGYCAFAGHSTLETAVIVDEINGLPVKEVWASGFKMHDLTSVVIGKNVEIIENFAFKDCCYIQSITFAENSKLKIIGESSFAGICEESISITLPKGLEIIGEYAFSYCSKSSGIVIPNTVETIGERAFESCSSLEELTIPSSCTYIGEQAFWGCEGLAYDDENGLKLILETENGYWDIHYYKYYASDDQYWSWCCWDCDSAWFTSCAIGAEEYVTKVYFVQNIYSSDLVYELNEDGESYSVSGGNDYTVTEINIPSTYNGKPVTRIAEAAFYGFAELTSITIQDSITMIGDYAFAECTSLTSITIPSGVTTIGNNAFYYCEALETIELPDGLLSLGDYAFHYCRSLKNVSIPRGVTEIKERTFGECESLTSIELHSDITSIGEYAFAYSGITSITIPARVTKLDHCAFWESNLQEVNFAPMSQLREIGSSCFQGTNLRSITIPNNVKLIDDFAFDTCSSLTTVSFEKISSLTRIGKEAFDLCQKLQSITIPRSVTTIGESVFSRCLRLTSLNVETGNPTYHVEGNCLIETLTNTLIAGFKNSVIPSSVTAIGKYAFQSCSGLTSITIPSSVTSIGTYAFQSCSELTTVTFDINSQITTIGDFAFNKCSNLTSITIPSSVTSIGTYAFQSCSKLTTVTFDINSQITTIGAGAFSYCSGLTSITIPSSVTAIGKYAFRYCSGLTSITIPSSVETIGIYAFYSCTNLTSIDWQTKAGHKWQVYFSSAWRDCSLYSDAQILTYAKGNYQFRQVVK